MSVNNDAAGFVLAGGRSSRMGSEKALIHLAGEPLLVHALRTLRQAGLQVSIAGAHSPLESYAPVVMDSESDRGPLGGICAALAATAASRAVFLPVDLPLLPAALITFLLQEARSADAAVTVPQLEGFVQTFPAVIDRAALPWLRASLESGRGKCISAFQSAAEGLGRSMKIVAIEPALTNGTLARSETLPVKCWFLNVNEHEDLARAEACLTNRTA